MIRPQFFIDTLRQEGIDFYTGVPDSLLKNICAYITDTLPARNNIIAANEGGAMGIAAGYYLATGKLPVVYMQNSGEGNIINPLASLTDKEVYNIPVLLVIGWRGKPGVHDEPQHVKQGKVTLSLLETMGIRHEILSKDEAEAARQIAVAAEYMRQTNEVYALVIEKDTFDNYTLKSSTDSNLTLTREEAIETVVECLPTNSVVVSTTGMISRELFEIRERRGEGHSHDFLTVGSMGHASQIALGISMNQPDKSVYCFDGDGASIMHMGGMAIVASMQPANYTHIVFNNGAHDSVGGQPTVGLQIKLTEVAKAVGYTMAMSVDSKEKLQETLATLNEERKQNGGPVLIEVRVKKGNRKDLGRPTTTPIQNKNQLMAYLGTSKKKNKPTTAVIMAAGMGTRFGKMTETRPKGFIECGGISMVERSIKTLLECGIQRIIIGTGYLKEEYERLALRYPQIECVFSPKYAETNSMFTLWNCRSAIGDDDFLLLESDIVYEKRAITALLECEKPDVMLITPVTKFQDQYYVEHDDEHRLTRCSTNKDDLCVKGELVGIHKLSNKFYSIMCKDYAHKADKEPKMGYEYELLAMSQSIMPVYVQCEEGLAWYEIDDADDLSYAEQNILNRL